jgi:hypothetical protein
LKDSITGLLKAMKQSREAEQQHLRQFRRLWKELQAQKIVSQILTYSFLPSLHPSLCLSYESNPSLSLSLSGCYHQRGEEERRRKHKAYPRQHTLEDQFE